MVGIEAKVFDQHSQIKAHHGPEPADRNASVTMTAANVTGASQLAPDRLIISP